MSKVVLTAAAILATLANPVPAEIEPSSVKMSMKITEESSCDQSNDCDSQGNLSLAGSQTFELLTSISDQFVPSTTLEILAFPIGDFSFTFDQDPNYQVGDESVSINVTENFPGMTQQANIKMSWKNGICKVSIKIKAEGEGFSPEIAIASQKANALPPGNPRNTGFLALNFSNGSTLLEESVGYFAIKGGQNMTLKPLPNNGVLTKSKTFLKSLQQVSEPMGLPI